MKKFLKIVFIMLLNICVLISFCGCNSLNKNKNSISQKVNSEISFLDHEVISMINLLNNINYDKYMVKTIKMDSSSKSEEQGKSGETSSKKEESGGDSEGSNSKQSEGQEQSGQEKSEQEEIFTMSANSIIGDEKQINWEELRSKIESLYSSWPIISIDLQEIDVSTELLNQFEKSMDLVAVAIKENNKDTAIQNLVELYKYLPEFTKSNGNESKKVILECKYNLLICYRYASMQDWEKLNEGISDLKMAFSNIRVDDDDMKGKEINVKNCFVIINGMENLGEIRDESVFFIKYRNLMKEFDNFFV